MEKISKGFFEGDVLVCGCTKSDNSYYRRLYKYFTANGIHVFPMPTKPESTLDFDTYADFSILPKIPKCAFVLSPKRDTPELINQLYNLGIQKIVFYGKSCADDAILADCKKHGIDVRIGCPLMLYAPGPCWLHAVVSGVVNERHK